MEMTGARSQRGNASPDISLSAKFPWEKPGNHLPTGIFTCAFPLPFFRLHLRRVSALQRTGRLPTRVFPRSEIFSYKVEDRSEPTATVLTSICTTTLVIQLSIHPFFFFFLLVLTFCQNFTLVWSNISGQCYTCHNCVSER